MVTKSRDDRIDCDQLTADGRRTPSTWLILLFLTYVLLISMLLTAAQPASASTIVVTSAQDNPDPPRITLREAVEQAQVGDTIVFDGSLSGSTITLSPVRGAIDLSDSLTISGGASRDTITVSGGGSTRVFRCLPDPTQSTIVIESLTIVDGNSGHGGAFFANRSTLNLTWRNCAFRRNHSEFAAGGGFMQVGQGLIDNCLFENNSAQQMGGALECGSFTTIRNCTFRNNTAGLGGGAAWVTGTTMENCEITGNRSYHSAAVEANQQVTLRNLNMHGNSSLGTPSTVRLNGVSRMINCQVHANLGGSHAVEISGPRADGAVELTDCSIYSNPDAPGITVTGVNPGSVRLTRCTIRDHRYAALDLGGAQTTTINDSTIVDNGFGISQYQSSNLDLHRVTIRNNGTALNCSRGEIRVVDCSILNNRSTGVFIGSDVRRATIEGSTISGNTAGTTAGGVYCQGQVVLIDRSTISGNRVTGSGGGLVYLNSGTSRLSITSSTITNNHADGRGGGVYIATGPPGQITVSNTIVAGNTDGATSEPDCSGSFVSHGYNLIGIVDGSAGWIDSDLTGDVSQPLDARLETLRDNGGYTFTHALMADSPAKNTGDPTLTNARDQRAALPNRIEEHSNMVRCRRRDRW